MAQQSYTEDYHRISKKPTIHPYLHKDIYTCTAENIEKWKQTKCGDKLSKLWNLNVVQRSTAIQMITRQTKSLASKGKQV